MASAGRGEFRRQNEKQRPIERGRENFSRKVQSRRRDRTAIKDGKHTSKGWLVQIAFNMVWKERNTKTRNTPEKRKGKKK